MIGVLFAPSFLPAGFVRSGLTFRRPADFGPHRALGSAKREGDAGIGDGGEDPGRPFPGQGSDQGDRAEAGDLPEHGPGGSGGIRERGQAAAEAEVGTLDWGT